MQDRKRDTDVQTDFWTLWQKAKVGNLREEHQNMYIIKAETDHQPGWMHEMSAQGWRTGKTQRDGMGREAGWGIVMGNTCKSMADSFQCMTKPTTIKKIKNK